MAFFVTYQMQIGWAADGRGSVGMAPIGPVIELQGINGSGPNGAVGLQVVPGGDTPTGANFTTALNSAATDISNQLNNTAGLLARVQGFATGTG